MIHYNELKHHRLAIHEFITHITQVESLNWHIFKEMLQQIGSRTLDLYIGNLSVNEVKAEVLEKLAKEGITTEQIYFKYIDKQQTQYLVETLSDSSNWVLRIGRSPLNFVHIHPGRYSPHTTRTHGNALKTAITILCNDRKYLGKELNTDYTNNLRQKIGLSPVKNSETLIKIKKLIDLLSS